MKSNVEALAKVLHEAGREAVERGLVVNNLGKPFLGWDAISDDAREGRRVQARYLLDRFEISPKASAADTSGEIGTPDPPPHLDGEIEPPAK